MKYRLLSLLLAALMLLALSACADTQTDTPSDDPTVGTTVPTKPEFTVVEPSQKSGVYQLSEPGHLLYLAEHPDKDYALCADIDMEGYEWTPVDTFSGTLTGLIYDVYNYTISNLSITAKEGDTNVGFFRAITGTVKEINFDNLSLTVPGTFSGNLGVVAGLCSATLTDVDVTNCSVTATVKDANVGMVCGKTENLVSDIKTTGALKVTLSGGTSYVGGAIGHAANLVMTGDIRTDLAVTGSGSGATGGLVGYAGNVIRTASFGGILQISTDATHAAGALVGELAKGGVTTCYNCARRTEITGAVAASEYAGIQTEGVAVVNCMTRDLSNLDEKLPAAEYAMRQKVADYMYKLCTVRWVPTKDITHTDTCGSHDQKYKAGQIYIGLPYAHTSNSLDKFLTYLNEDGTLKDEAYAAVGTKAPNGLKIEDVVDFIGNDCADAVYWAWARVSGSISYTLTDNMLCINGVVPVGNYEVSSNSSTRVVCSTNGQNKMYEAYAKVQMGDGFLYAPGHARMAAEASYVFRNADGTIDGEKSYVLMHEQGAGCKTLDTRHTTCNTFKQYTFAALFKANYIPVTIEAFANGKADTLTATTTNTDQTKAGVGAGVVSANYRLERVTLKITDGTGKVVLNTFCHPVYGDHDMADHVTSQDLAVFANEIAVANLETGKEYTYSVYVSAGEQEVCVQTFKFTA